MAKLSDLVNLNINRTVIKIQDAEIPVIFTFKSFPYLEQAYKKPYHIFEKDLNRMMKKGKVQVGKNEIRIMYALIYAMVRSGGTDCTPTELENSIPLSDLPGVFQTAIDIFQNQTFQQSDANKIKSQKKS